jgi:hypothetical protein
MEDIFGDLARDEGWRERVTAMYTLISEEGILTAIDALMAKAEGMPPAEVVLYPAPTPAR